MPYVQPPDITTVAAALGVELPAVDQVVRTRLEAGLERARGSIVAFIGYDPSVDVELVEWHVIPSLQELMRLHHPFVQATEVRRVGSAAPLTGWAQAGRYLRGSWAPGQYSVSAEYRGMSADEARRVEEAWNEVALAWVRLAYEDLMGAAEWSREGERLVAADVRRILHRALGEEGRR